MIELGAFSMVHWSSGDTNQFFFTQPKNTNNYYLYIIY